MAPLDRYFGSDYYCDMYNYLENSKYAIKTPAQETSKKGYIERPPKGAEVVAR